MDRKHLTANDRFYIERRLGDDISLRQIARELEVSPVRYQMKLGATLCQILMDFTVIVRPKS